MNCPSYKPAWHCMKWLRNTNWVIPKKVAFSLHPNGIWTLEAIKKAKALKLVPLGHLTKLKDPPPKEYYCIEHGGARWQINPWKQYTTWAGAPKRQECPIPFWWAKGTKENSNMEMCTITHGSFKVPCFQNSKPLAANELLQYQKAEDTQEDIPAQGSQAAHLRRERPLD